MSADKTRVLVVDDSVDTSTTMASLLELLGIEVRTAASGEIALESYLSFRPQAVLLDLEMPGMDGFEVCRTLRRMPGSESVLVVIVTGYIEEEQKARAMQAGANYYFVKPAEFTKLAELVTQHGLLTADAPHP